MFQIFSLIFPLAASILALMAFKKAGFRGGILIVCFTPVLAALLHHALVYAVTSNALDLLPETLQLFLDDSFLSKIDLQTTFYATSVITSLLSLIPIAILGLAQWPRDRD